MKLPKVEKAFIETKKIVAYLLSEENSGGKAVFFIAFGFHPTQPEVFEKALLAHATTHEVAQISRTPHGIKYIIDGRIQTPDGRSPQLRSVWIVDSGEDAPRLVTAYPLEGDNR